jgi:hypothetical protein
MCFNEPANLLIFCAFGRQSEAQNIEQLNMCELTQLEKELDAIFIETRYQKVNCYKLIVNYLYFFLNQ